MLAFALLDSIQRLKVGRLQVAGLEAGRLRFRKVALQRRSQCWITHQIPQALGQHWVAWTDFERLLGWWPESVALEQLQRQGARILKPLLVVADDGGDHTGNRWSLRVQAGRQLDRAGGDWHRACVTDGVCHDAS